MPSVTVKGIVNALAEYVTGESDLERDRGEDKLLQLGVLNLAPATMSRSTGDFEIAIAGKTLKCHYAVSAK